MVESSGPESPFLTPPPPNGPKIPNVRNNGPETPIHIWF